MTEPLVSTVPAHGAATHPPRASDAELGNLRTLFASHARDLERYARRIVRSREAAQDVVQEVFLLLWIARERVDLGECARSYLYVTTRARAINHLRRERRARQVTLNALRDAEALPPEGEARVARHEVESAIARVLALMPPRQRAVASLRLQRQRSTLEIAHELGMSPRTVELHVARATQALRARLPPLLGGDLPGAGPAAASA